MAQESPRLYVGNLPYVANKEDIEKLFAENNVQIKKVDISIDPFSGRNPSYCFVEFPSHEDADTAMNTLQGVDLQGRPIRINPKTERRSGPTTERYPPKTYDRSWGSRDGASRAGTENSYSNRWNRSDAPEVTPEEQKRVYVGGLPKIADQDSLEAEMKSLFENYDVQTVSKLITPHASKWDESASQCFCFVDLATVAEAAEAVRSLNGRQTPHDGIYRVSHAKGRRPAATGDRVEREQAVSTSKVFVSGLPVMESHDDVDHCIRELFAGLEITDVSKLITPHESKQIESGLHHYCFATFARPEEAQRAVEAMNGQPTPNGGSYKISFARERPVGGFGPGERLPSRENVHQSRGGFPQREGQDSPRRPPREHGPAVHRDFGSSWRRRE